MFNSVLLAVLLVLALSAYSQLKSLRGRSQRSSNLNLRSGASLADGKPCPPPNVPVSVNYHFTRVCNMSCGFCFHTATTSHVLRVEQAKRGIYLLKAAGMRKMNFAGGEPFLYPKLLGCLVDYCKDLGLESVSIVSNGSKIAEEFLRRHGRNIDILAVSCDSFDEQTNVEIGRGTGSNVHQLYRVKSWCDKYGIMFKLNTVVCNLNWQEDMNNHLSALRPSRWKCFQVLIVTGENDSSKRLRNGTKYTITSDQFERFVDRHSSQPSIVPEPNRLMAKSYLILDEYMRFLDRDGRQPSRSILEVGVEQALRSVNWDVDSFHERGGLYDWSAQKEDNECSSRAMSGDLEW